MSLTTVIIKISSLISARQLGSKTKKSFRKTEVKGDRQDLRLELSAVGSRLFICFRDGA